MEQNLNLICTNNGKAYFDGLYYNGKSVIGIKDLYKYGFSCHSCRHGFECEAYKEGLACRCDLRKRYKPNTDVVGDNICRIDDRLLCEFYELKRPSDFDSIKKFPIFLKKESELNFDILDDLFSGEDLYLAILKTANEALETLDFLNGELRANFEKSEKLLKESEDFIKFFKSEIPDVYKKLKGEFNRLIKNE